jgi:hypothetical protein
MIKLFSVKEKQKQDAAAAAAGKPKQSAGELRVQKGEGERELRNVDLIVARLRRVCRSILARATTGRTRSA